MGKILKGSLDGRGMAATRHLGSLAPQRVIKAIIPSASDPMTVTTPAIDPFAGIPKLPLLSGAPNNSFDTVDIGNVSDRNSLSEIYKSNTLNVNLAPQKAPRELLRQYNSLVADDNSLSIKHASPLKLTVSSNGNKMNKKAKRASKRNSVFTAGISSISKPQRPSFTVPRESINRANLPRSVMVEQLNDQFTFGLKSRKEKSRFTEMNTPKFKQMRVFGLDSFPTIDLERHISNALMQTGIRGNTKVKVGYGKKIYPRKLEPIRHNSEGGVLSRDFYMESKFPKGRNTYISDEEGLNSPTSDGRLNVVSFGNPETFSDSGMKRILRNSYPSQYDWKLRQQDVYRRSKFEERDTTVSGICSLAPIRMGNISALSSTNNNQNMREQAKSRRSHNTSIDGDTVFESDLESLLNTTGFKLNKQEGTRDASAASHFSNASQSVRLNPPPSASSNEDDEDMPLPSFPKIMIPLHEELSTMSLSTTSRNTHHEQKSRLDHQDTFSDFQHHKSLTATSEDLTENVPNVYVQNMRLDLTFVDKGKDLKFEKKITSSRKGGDFSSRTPVNVLFEDANTERSENAMMINGSMLNIPFVDTGIETRPSVTDRSNASKYDANGLKLSENPSENVRPVSEHSIPIPRVAVQTLNPFPKLESIMRVAPTPAISVTFDTGEKQTIQNSHDNHITNENDSIADNRTIDSDSTLKHVVVNNKTLQFISPLQVQNYAKRQ